MTDRLNVRLSKMFKATTANRRPFRSVALWIRARAELTVILMSWISLATKKLLKCYLDVVYAETDLPVTVPLTTKIHHAFQSPTRSEAYLERPSAQEKVYLR